jgi:diguanylate cyclase (GGDEF)-like protein/PAS domain S-box-containing protein
MNNKTVREVLLIEDNPGDARLLQEMFREHRGDATALTWIPVMGEAETYLAAHKVDVILLDLGLTDAQGMAAVRRARAAAPLVALVVLTGLDDQSVAAEALQEGAGDYLIKGEIEPRGLMRSLRYAIERLNMQTVMNASSARAIATLNCIGDAVACTDMSGTITFLNQAAESLTGWSSVQAQGRPMAEVFQIINGATRRPVLTPLGTDAIRLAEFRLPPHAVLVRRDGFETAVEDSIAPIRDRNGLETGAVFVLRDATRTRAMTKEITHAAEHDFLTGLPNRIVLNDRISQAIAAAARKHGGLALLFLDIDGFKHINDSLGHAVGDRLLESIARRLVLCVRGTDTVSRQGGDEFIILLGELGSGDRALISAKRLLAAIAEPHFIDGHDLHVTASIGISVYPEDGLDAETLIKNADTAMYQAKENGRQGYQFFKQAMNVRAVERQSIEESLRRAVERREFILHYQPRINLASGAITGVEALLRWQHPVRGLVSPAQFIPVAEDCGLILSIGAWVLQEACTQARTWLDAGLPAAKMAVNVSSIEFQDVSFSTRIFKILEESGLPPTALEVELTESVLMKRSEQAIAILGALHERGVTLAIDDFGTGYSSLSYLRRFPIDVLKIDQSFIRQISHGGDDTAIVTAVIGLAKNLKLSVVAEGVETQKELDFLRAQRCDEVQGFYFSRPVEAQRFERLLRFGILPETEPVDESNAGWPERGKSHRPPGSTRNTPVVRLPHFVSTKNQK